MIKLIFKFLISSLLLIALSIGFISQGVSNSSVPLRKSEHCRILLPIDIKDDDWNYYADYITFKLSSESLFPMNLTADQINADNSMRFGFNLSLSCPDAYANNLMFELVSPEIFGEFKEMQRDKKIDSKFEQNGNKCLVKSNLPVVQESFPEQIRTFLKQHILSFVDLKFSKVNFEMNEYTFTFNGRCEDILVDYYYQKLFPLEYFKEKSKTKN